MKIRFQKIKERLLSAAKERKGFLKVKDISETVRHHVNFKCAAALSLVLVFTLAASNFQVCYAVSLNGETVGMADSKEELDEVLVSVETEAIEILGETRTTVKRKIEKNLEVKPSLAVRNENDGDLKESMLSNIEGISESYTLYIDGRAIGTLDSALKIHDVLNEIAEQYMDDDTVSICFAEDVTIEKGFENEDLLMEYESLKEILTAEEDLLTVKTTKKVTYEEPIAYGTDVIKDDTMYVDEQEVVSAGKEGRALVSAYAQFENGKLIGHSVIDVSQTNEPVNEVVKKGTLEREYIWPAKGRVSSYFGPRSVSVGSSNHQGIDICGSRGSHIVAAASGEVIFAGWQRGYGNLLQVKHDNGSVTYYAHNSGFNVSLGQRVEQGDVIAFMGNTGVSSGVHCHFEIRIDGVPVNPMKYL